MLTRAELKQQAKEQLKGNLGMLFLCTLIVTAISFVIALIPVVGTVATYIIAPPLSLGLIMVYLSVTYGEKVEIGTLFNGFQCFGKSILLYILIRFSLYYGPYCLSSRVSSKHTLTPWLSIS